MSLQSHRNRVVDVKIPCNLGARHRIRGERTYFALSCAIFSDDPVASFEPSMARCSKTIRTSPVRGRLCGVRLGALRVGLPRPRRHDALATRARWKSSGESKVHHNKFLETIRSRGIGAHQLYTKSIENEGVKQWQDGRLGTAQ